MANPNPPTRDDALLAWLNNFVTVATPTPSSFGLSAADITGLTPLVATFSSTLATAQNPSTKTQTTVALKDSAKAAVLADVRYLIKRVNGASSVTTAQKISLGITIKSAPSVIPPPSTRPIAAIFDVVGRTVTARLSDEATPTKRKKPAGVSEAEIFSYISTTANPNPPSDLTKWTYQGQASKTEFDVTFPLDTAPGTQVWICARWCNRRGEAGPVSDSVGTFVGGGITAEAA